MQRAGILPVQAVPAYEDGGQQQCPSAVEDGQGAHDNERGNLQGCPALVTAQHKPEGHGSFKKCDAQNECPDDHDRLDRNPETVQSSVVEGDEASDEPRNRQYGKQEMLPEPVDVCCQKAFFFRVLPRWHVSLLVRFIEQVDCML